MTRTITIVPALPKLEQRKRVAAYARVSSGKDAMLHSLSAQVSYYSSLIQKHGDWLYVGVYADEAKIGTKDNRADFQRLIADCRAGKIDMVITKSISRFARNTVTLLQIVRELKALGVDVFFEEQNIHTMSADGELMMTILASYAQEESRSASENQKWRIKRNFEAGMPWNGTLLGYRMVDGRYEIIPEEAELVRRIYTLYLSGLGYAAIANKLNAEGVATRLERTWHQATIGKMLTNYAYTGNLFLQRTYRKDHISKCSRPNRGELPMYHAEETHDPIIAMETFNAVQAERERRAARFANRTKPQGTYPFTSLLVCENCGKHYKRKPSHNSFVWICSTLNLQGKAACASKQIPEAILLHITAEVLGVEEITREALCSRVHSILVCANNTLIYRFHDGTEVSRIWQDRSRRQSWAPEMKEAARQKMLQRRNADA